MASDLVMRLATEGDWPSIWPFWHEIVAAGDTYSYDPAITSDAARLLWLSSSPDETWLAESAGAVVGTYHLTPNQAGPGSHIANASYMVDSATRGLGVGRSMVLHSLDRARALGYLGIQFNAVAATNVHAIRLYHELGFATVGKIPHGFRHPEQGLVDLLIMYRALKDSSRP